MPAVDQLLKFASWTLSDLDVIAVTRGPGSFTGVRIALTTAKTLAFAIKCAIIPLGSLEVLAGNLVPQTGLLVPVFDARKKEVFGAIYRAIGSDLSEVMPPRAADPEVFARDLRAVAADNEPVILTGSGLRPYAQVFRSVLGHQARLASAFHWQPRAAVAAFLAGLRIRAGCPFEPIDGVREYAQVNPIYCRKSEAEIGWEARTGAPFVPPPPAPLAEP